MSIRRLRYSAGEPDFNGVDLMGAFRKELQSDGITYSEAGKDIVITNPKLSVVDSLWEQARDEIESNGGELPISNPYLFVTLEPQGDLVLHTEYPPDPVIFILNGEELEAPGDINTIIDYLINNNYEFENASANIKSCMGNAIDFNFDGSGCMPATFLHKWKVKMAPPEVNEHVEEPDDVVDQTIFDANMNVMNNDYKIQELRKQIDEALDSGDQAKFQELTDQYNKLLNYEAIKGKRLLKRRSNI